MKIGMHEVSQGVAVAKCRLCNQSKHLRKAKDQCAPSIVKTLVFQNVGPSKLVSRGVVVIYYSLGSKDLVVG